MDLRDQVRASTDDSAIETLPLVPLRENVVFPHQLAPLGAGRPRSVAALEAAVQADGRVVLAVQRNAEVDDVGIDDVYPIAVVANVGAFRKLPTGAAQALVEGQRRVMIRGFESSGDRWTATVVTIDEPFEPSAENDALVGSVKTLFGDYVGAGAAVAPELVVAVTRTTEAARVTDMAGAAPDIAVADKMALLQEVDVAKRLRALVPLLAKQVEVASLRSKIQEDVQKTINKGQREAILREQLRAIRKELSELDGSSSEEEEDLATRVENAGMPDAVRTRALKEVQRLEQIPSASPELGMVRTYVDWLLDLPWRDPPPENVDIARAKRILDEDHYGLPKVKDRILEWLAVRARAQQRIEARARLEAEAAELAASDAPAPPASSDAASTPEPLVEDPRPRRTLQTPILCLVGPPGVGKTSLGRSIARALDRKFVRLSLGGIRDEAEIRGHRRTYIGALPGRIIQSMKQAGVRNPVIMLDEVDKVGADFRGDPSAALLEVLDPEQNREFSDHYLEVAYDLSQVLFITTANVAETISPPLRDRMEIIRISGYTEEEKVGIAEQHLVPRQREQHGLEEAELTLDHDALVEMIRGWTREAGVRQLDRTIAQVARKLPRKLAESEGALTGVTVHVADLPEYLGPSRFEFGEAESEDQVGAVTGVVVSDVGGDIVTVEALAIEGKNDLLLTGQLGSVMEESARAALSWARVHAEEYGAPKGFFDNHGVHVHVPAGAIPKDGPSAGVTMTTALVSVASGRPVRRDLAMTGEVTLRGRVLPIGGVKDKLLAAHRAGLSTFVLPRKNVRDLEEVDKEVLEKIEVIPVDNVAEVLERALLPKGGAGAVHERRVGFLVATPHGVTD
ncbi:MAG TPA: endopeptidase La [Candidatus Dormibacteraeota bacterium]|jgi:ATP-dependent Lon protease|nr:endopeptidase La [Candidatus Dormibacteraeota bacterium]